MPGHWPPRCDYPDCDEERTDVCWCAKHAIWAYEQGRLIRSPRPGLRSANLEGGPSRRPSKD